MSGVSAATAAAAAAAAASAAAAHLLLPLGSPHAEKDPRLQGITLDGHFGSGWVWLCINKEGGEIKETHDGVSAPSQDLIPLLTIDVWEHAYYIDYKNARASYVDRFWGSVNWEVVEKRLTAAETLF
ncbi:superoxide dismutase, putative [Eimeria maxima]|uniref:superoxide dismutase n=1 Tax=Eimeria maxima TaxID=5804 RepID=U6M5E9_EIMMA|nr:superoxide dismutase, putative [Eimeria maxima]CDJ57659.1 superoxide dismutase, putative [Eimeria maxima]